MHHVLIGIIKAVESPPGIVVVKVMIEVVVHVFGLFKILVGATSLFIALGSHPATISIVFLRSF